MSLHKLLIPILFLLLFSIPGITADQAIIATTDDGDQIVVLPTPDVGLPNPAQNTVPGLPSGKRPHGVANAGNGFVLVSDFANSRVFIVQNNVLVDTIQTATYSGSGTIAVSPNLSFALACGFNNILTVIQAPFNSTSPITTITLPGMIQSYQTQAIVFDSNGRAFVYHTTGISVLDPPYNSISFTINYENDSSGSIAITPDGNTLLVTDLASGNVGIFTAPFSKKSDPTILNIPGADSLDGIKTTPDGMSFLVGNAFTARLFCVSAPYDSSSTFNEIALPAGVIGASGFEHIDINSDASLAIVTGNSVGDLLPAVFVQPPFCGAARAMAIAVPITSGGRGAGAVSFIPPVDFSIDCQPATQTTVADGSASSTCNVRSISGFSDPVNLSCSGLSAGVTCAFDTSPVTPPSGGSSASGLTVNVGSNVQPGTYNFSVDGSSGSLNHSMNFALNVVVPIFMENFSDGNADGWTFTDGDWSVQPAALARSTRDGFALQGTVEKKGDAFSPDFVLGIGTLEADIQVLTPGAKVSLLMWFTDKKNLVELQILEGKDKYVLKQKGDGKTGKSPLKRRIDPNTNIHIKATFDGNSLQIFVDNEPAAVINMPAVATPSGKVGLRIKGEDASASIANIIAY